MTTISAQAFRVWQAQRGLKGTELAERLGKNTETISRYRLNGVPERDTKLVGLALAAIEAGLQPWVAP